jgi:hypothetical protein
MPFNISAVQVVQKVHSNVQMTASFELGGRSLSQHSQLGRSSNMNYSSMIEYGWANPQQTDTHHRQQCGDNGAAAA